jgi:hypothetical protein
VYLRRNVVLKMKKCEGSVAYNSSRSGFEGVPHTKICTALAQVQPRLKVLSQQLRGWRETEE